MHGIEIELHIPSNLKNGYFKIQQQINDCKDSHERVRRFVWHNRKENFIIVKPYECK